MPGVTVPPLTNYIVAEVRLQGKTSGGDDIESNLFRYDIYVVDSSSGVGLVRYNGVDDKGYPICDAGVCGNNGTSTTTSQQSCYEGQDGTTSCCDCILEAFCQAAP